MNSPIIYYDSNCALCHSAVRFILRTDQKSVFHFSPLSQLPPETLINLPDSLVLKMNNEYFVEGKAVLEILKKLSWGWRFLGTCLNLIPLVVLDQAYRFIANNRKRWELDVEKSCPLIPVELRERLGIS